MHLKSTRRMQNYKNHVRYYTPHHFIFYPVVVTGFIMSCLRISGNSAQHDLWIAIAALFFIAGWLSFMLRQHYALGNQNRLVRLELRLRYFIITGQRLEPLEEKLSFSQLAALRFASDEELPLLIGKAIQEKLSPSGIKESIRQWTPDHMRV